MKSEAKAQVDTERLDFFSLIIPSLDPDEKLAETVTSAINAGISDIILVDDGSAEDKRQIFDGLKDSHPEVTLLRHEVNRGKGAALKTALSYIKENRPGTGGAVTADGDGQHRTEDIIACAKEMRDTGCVILGCRDFSLEGVPFKSRFGNGMTSAVFRIFCGMKLSDTQTGLRAIPAAYFDDMTGVDGSRYEYETNMLIHMGRYGIPYREVKIETIYYDDNKASHFRPIRDSIRVYGLILKYIASSMISSGLDLLLFYLWGEFVFGSDFWGVFASTVTARVISMAVNFTINKNLVFGSRKGIFGTVVRYVCVAVPVMLASWLSVYAISEGLAVLFDVDEVIHIGRTIIKIPIDIILFLISFRIQQKWVFTDKKRGNAHG